MKYLGQHPKRCTCKFCIGKGNSKPINKALKHKGRQQLLKELKKELK